MTDLRYPVGPFVAPAATSPELRAELIRQMAEAPAKLRRAVEGLSAAQLATPYRDGGWTVRQVVHHVPDSHMNAYVRFKMAVTEERPPIRAYDEAAWARLPEASTADIGMSLDLLEALHQRFVLFLESLDEAQFARPYVHPEMGEVPVHRGLALYAWHGRHHVAHITALRQRMEW